MQRVQWFKIVFTLALGFNLLFGPALAAPREWLNRLDPWVLETAAAGETEMIIYLREQADLSQAAFLPDRQSKAAYVYQTLRRIAERTQKPLRQVLDGLGVEYRAYWVANVIWVRGGMTAVQTLANHPLVAHVYANPIVKLDAPEPLPPNRSYLTLQPQGVEWNLALVNANDVWAAGFTGQNVVIGGADTGYQWNHPALIRQYRGWNGQAADHNYNWHDAIHFDHPNTNPGNPCGFDSPQPCDDYGHGTHTMGIMIGDDSAGNQIGMAPGARWIGCRNMEQGWSSPITYIECYQWFIAPTDLNNQNPDPSKAPDVINNSWSCPPSEGCTDPQVLQQVVENVRAAGILTVHSAGNGGPGCGSISDPAAIYDASFTVGNTTLLDGLNSSSSRGPVIADGSGRLKPDISAPGTGIRSSYPTNSYAYMTGTSMAAPHVAGMAALLISANPALAGRVDDLERWMTQTALPLNIPLEICGGVPSTAIPNNAYGWGRINAWGPFERRLHLSKTALQAAVKPGAIITYTLTVNNLHLLEPSTGLTLTDTLPDGSEFLSATSPYTLTDRTISWEMVTLPPGSSWNLELVVKATGAPGSQVVNADYNLQTPQGWFLSRGPAPLTVILFQNYHPFVAWSDLPWNDLP